MTSTITSVEDLMMLVAGEEPKTLSHDDIRHLPAPDIRALISRLRSKEKPLSEQIAHKTAKLEALHALSDPTSRDSMLDLSIDVKNLQAPAFPFGVPDTLWIGTNGHTVGHTTFRYCGHCKHVAWWSGGRAGCGLVDDVTRESGSPFTSKCFVITWPWSKIVARASELSREVRRMKVLRDIIRTNIRYLLSRIALAPAVPQQWAERGRSCFAYGDRVRVYTYSDAFGKHKDMWAPATVVVQDGIEQVHLVFDAPIIEDRHPFDRTVTHAWRERAWALSPRTPFIMHEWEFEFFVRDAATLPAWMGSRTKWYLHDTAKNATYNPSREECVAALQDTNRHLAPCESESIMSYDAACRRLGFVTDPASAQDVVDAYRAARNRAGDGPALRRAKDTLLIRVLRQEGASG